MVFRKYRAVKQWGKMDTRIFKEIYNSRNNRKMPSFEVPEAIKALNVKIHETTDESLFERQTKTSNVEASNIIQEALNKPVDFKKIQDFQHPLYKPGPAFIFEGAEPMSDGIAQASLLTRSVVRYGLPESLLKNGGIEIDEDKVKDAILHGERYNPTLEKLPRRFDPVLFWVNHARVYGTPVIKRNNIILDNLLRQVIFAGLRSGLVKNMQISRDEPLSVYLSGGRYFSDTPLVLRGQPHLTVQSHDESVNMPWAGHLDTNEAQKEPLPDIYPISPVIDFTKDHIYNEDVLISRKTQKMFTHSILWSREQDQKYPWTSEQNMANAILTTYAAAMAQSKLMGESKPMLVRGVQLVNGRLDLVAMQLNTPLLTNDGDDTQKNIVWIEKGIRLYKPKPYYEQMEEVEHFNIESFKKFAALMMGFGKSHAH